MSDTAIHLTVGSGHGTTRRTNVYTLVDILLRTTTYLMHRFIAEPKQPRRSGQDVTNRTQYSSHDEGGK